jgi:biopolymer transport protein ExbD
MAKSKRYYDIWIIETNTVYREVPYEVVTDWLQQGRLLGSDKARPAGASDWFELAQLPEIAAYAPRREEHRAEDVAEALEPVELEMNWKRSPGDDDQDVDMIPLIDVSLVLLIFFMMTSTVSGLPGNLTLPEINTATGKIAVEELWLGIERNKEQKDAAPIFSLGIGNAQAREGDKNLDFAAAMQHLDEKLANLGQVNLVTIRGDRDLDSGTIKQVRRELDIRRSRGQIKEIGDTVLERPNA